MLKDTTIPLKFYETDFTPNSKKLILTDEMFELLDTPFSINFLNEAEVCWQLVETAWELGVSRNTLSIKYDVNNNNLFVMDNYLKRKDITSARNALNGYQKGKCFYCFSDITTDSKDVSLCDIDHFFSHSLKSSIPNVNLDGVWNLVLSNNSCNRGKDGKFAKIPTTKYLKRLYKRNEFLIASHHPLRETLMQQTGSTEEERKNFLKEIDKIAMSSFNAYRWETTIESEEVF